MPTSLNILHLEDSRTDAELIQARLISAGIPCSFTWVKSQPEFARALQQEAFDVILSDFTLPQFDGRAALALARETVPQCPFIFVSGTLGEDTAIEAIKNGATDYVLKDRPARLAEAVQRALREAAEQAQRRRAEAELKRSEEQLRALAARLQAAREEERLRISREMHDGLGEMLTRMDVNLVLLRSLAEQKELTRLARELPGKIAELRSAVSGTAELVRKLCTELRPPILDDLGLTAALEWQAKQFQARTGIRCETRFEAAPALGKEQAISVFRIFQEILTNVARHSQASKVRMVLQPRGDLLVLEVKDNGRGIRLEEAAGSRSLGLLGMRERACLLGGSIEFDGAPGKGTTVSLRLRVERPETRG